jgi:membrane fusion protein (multidrug efflux system)
MRLITMAWNKRSFGRSAKLARLFTLVVLACSGFDNRLAAEDLEQKFEGLVVARRSVQVVPQINGVVSRILFAAGQSVAQGDVLFELNADALQIDVSTAQADLAEARARLALAEDEAGRQAQLSAAHAGVAARTKQTGIEAEIARAVVLRRESELARAKLTLSRAHIVAPISGKVGRPHIVAGAFVEAKADTLLAELVQLDPILVAFDVPYIERERAFDKAGTSSVSDVFNRITLSLQLPSGRPYDGFGVPESESAEIDRTTGMITVWGRFANPDNILIPGLRVRVTSHLSEQRPN